MPSGRRGTLIDMVPDGTIEWRASGRPVAAGGLIAGAKLTGGSRGPSSWDCAANDFSVEPIDSLELS